MQLIRHVMDCSFTFIAKYGRFPMAYSQISVMHTFLVIFKYYIRQFDNEDEKIPKNIEDLLQNVIIMSLMWSIGAILEEQVRSQFHEYMMELIKGEDV
jgi:hypothetical protein